MFYTYESYESLPKALTMEQMHLLHTQIVDDVGTDEDAVELYKELLADANRYAVVRANWLLQSREKRMEADERRKMAHDTFIRHLDVLARYLRGSRKEVLWRDALGDEADDVNNRKAIGDFACYLSFISALNMR